MILAIKCPLKNSLHDLLVVLRGLPQCRHDLLWEISRLSSTPADTLPFSMIHVTKVIQSPCLTHLKTSREKKKQVLKATVFSSFHTTPWILCRLTLSLVSLAMSKCLWQQTMASSNRPNTFNVLPRFPLALASPSRSPIVLHTGHTFSQGKMLVNNFFVSFFQDKHGWMDGWICIAKINVTKIRTHV